MLGVIDVGGGLRGIYGAGVLDACLDMNINFDYCIGVSAGSANIASYIAGQKGRNKTFYTDYSFRKDYMSFSNLIKKGSFVDLEYIYATLSNEDGEYPLNFDAVKNSDKIFKVVATNALSGQPVYFDKSDMSKNNYDVIKSSCSLPVVNRPYSFAGGKYYDGGISDPIPVGRAFFDGCDKVVVILTRPRDFYRDGKRESKTSVIIKRKYPLAAEALATRHVVYNKQLNLCKQYEKEGKVLIVAPDDISGMGTLTKDKEQLLKLYDKGYRDAEAIKEFIK